MDDKSLPYGLLQEFDTMAGRKADRLHFRYLEGFTVKKWRNDIGICLSNDGG
jgi:hypothetical protein